MNEITIKIIGAEKTGKSLVQALIISALSSMTPAELEFIPDEDFPDEDSLIKYFYSVDRQQVFSNLKIKIETSRT